jgi:hypothetical protein
MIWLAWRQFRTQALVAGCALAIFTILLLVSGFSLAHLYSTSGLPGCSSHGSCDQSLRGFQAHLRGSFYAVVFYTGIALIYGGSALIGTFWGAPLVAREIETGTFRVAWNQSVSRSRWLIVKVVMVGLTAMILAGLLGLMLTWWAQPVYKAAGVAGSGTGLSFDRFSPLMFGTYGIAPIGYAALAFALGLAIGMLIKRTIPAMATTLAGFAFIEIAWPNWIRPHLIPAARSTSPLLASQIQGLTIGTNQQMTVYAGVNKPGGWVLSSQTVSAAGQPFAGHATPSCLNGTPQCNASIAALHLKELVVYQPAGRFWSFQLYETGLFIAIAIGLAIFCSWWIRRRQLT